jgi:UDP-perosamine 4-acetyltransferase
MGKARRRVAVVCAEKEAIELVASLPGFRLVGVIDQDPRADALGLPILGGDDDWPAIRRRIPGLRVVLGLDRPAVREALTRRYGPDALASAVAPDALVSPTASVGPGALIQHGVKILARAHIGMGCKINADAVVHHDCVVGDFCTLAPGCRLLGSVRLGDRVFVGAGAILLPRVTVAAGCVIGAGAVVVRDVAAGLIVAGVPARPLRPRARRR